MEQPRRQCGYLELMLRRRTTILALPILWLLFLLPAPVEIVIATSAQTLTVAETEEHKRAIELYRQSKFVDASKLLRKVLEDNEASQVHSRYIQWPARSSSSNTISIFTECR